MEIEIKAIPSKERLVDQLTKGLSNKCILCQKGEFFPSKINLDRVIV